MKIGRLTKPKFIRMDAPALAAAAGATLLFFWFGLRPVLYLHNRHAAQRSQVKSQQRGVVLMGTLAETLEQKLAEVRTALAQSPVRLEPAAAVNSRISQLAALAADSGLKVDEVQPAKPVHGRTYGSVPIRVSGRGDYRTWAVFLHTLSKSFPDTAVDSFVLSGKHDAPGSLAEFQINLVWHVIPEQAPGRE